MLVSMMLPTRKTIKDWATDDRPREKMMLKGPASLSNSELLAILIQVGTADKTALELAKEVLDLSQGDLMQLGKLNIREFTTIKGIGMAKAITLAAALELGRRRQSSESHKPIIKTSSDIALYLQAQLKDQTKEIFAIVLLNRANMITHLEWISSGGITGTVADPRIILKKAILHEAVGLILCHNHPSGNLKPSKADEDITQKIKSAAAMIDIRLLDHIIVSDRGYFSFADEGML